MNMPVRQILSELRDALQPLYGKRLAELVLFGSHARGDDEFGSDVDVLVVLEGEVDPGTEIARTGRMACAISLEHDAVVSCTFVSADRYRRERSPLLMNVRKEGVQV
jgi:predicted nucleotidyltransferase